VAKKIVHLLIDDLDGSEAAETVRFGIDGFLYEIDLTTKNATKLREAVAPFQSAGQRLGKADRAARQQPTGHGPGHGEYRRTQLLPSGETQKQINAKIREWAAEYGITVSDRGRIKQEIVNAYNGRGTSQADALLQDAYHATGTTPPAPEAPAPRQRAKKTPAFSSGNGI
jgi:hypothetical protein